MKKKILKPFEGKNEKMRKLDIVNVCIPDTKIQNLTDVELTVVPHICSPISDQTIDLPKPCMKERIYKKESMIMKLIISANLKNIKWKTNIKF